MIFFLFSKVRTHKWKLHKILRMRIYNSSIVTQFSSYIFIEGEREREDYLLHFHRGRKLIVYGTRARVYTTAARHAMDYAVCT